MEQATLTLRIAPELRFFLPPRHRNDAPVHTDHDGTSTLGHVVESLGIPRTEIGTLYADGHPVDVSHHPDPTQVIDVTPVPRPQPLPPGFDPPRFLLDVHLGTLARRLRLLGLDTDYHNDRDDPTLVRQANDQHRVLLTRDRKLLCRKALRAGAHIHHDQPDHQLTDVLERFAPPLAPWTRCLECNGPLSSVDKGEVAHTLPAGTRATYDTFARCEACEHLYWPGAHHEHLTQIIRDAQATLAAPPTRQPSH
ncbi:Mut7-C ubiquitin/RNAse domain-containing protein [Nocardiopsis sp. EMB25]|uniref:Mut7-C RNAse domain-containing protein n=1 Tax=Nocardiopsis sp. EMB25 TaxID=2835867 RepID=UPI0022849140|nr:Mut7-C RNAse domain-containing protein [Nocardiopsis sp. EMB25]MCY9783809.1 Mut7-C ubiquitin/RNAse domain-containing protein [Nocardiopsis sp. EMB25]